MPSNKYILYKKVLKIESVFKCAAYLANYKSWRANLELCIHCLLSWDNLNSSDLHPHLYRPNINGWYENWCILSFSELKAFRTKQQIVKVFELSIPAARQPVFLKVGQEGAAGFKFALHLLLLGSASQSWHVLQ